MTETSTHFPSIADRHLFVGDLKLAYRDEGAGQTILCLHALGHSSKDFASLYRLPLDKFRIVALDFPGCGDSEKGEQQVSASYYAEIMRRFIEKLGLKDFIIVGNSIGGAVALRLAAENPQVKMLALANPGGLDKRGFLAPLFLQFMVCFFRKGVDRKPNFERQFDRYYKKVLPTETAAERRNEIVRDAYPLAPLLVEGWTSFKSETEDLRPLIEKINCPVLFTWAMKDRFVQYGRNRRAIQKFKNYKLIKYPIGHTPYLECPDLFLQDFNNFVVNFR